MIVIGNLTRDPVLKTTQSGQPVATFGIATNREWITKDGQKHTSTEFHEVVAWAKLAEIAGNYLKKGKLVYIEGYLKTRSWEMEDETKRYRTEIVIQDLVILEKKGANSDDDYAAAEETNSSSELSAADEGSISTEEPPLDELDLGGPISEELAV